MTAGFYLWRTQEYNLKLESDQVDVWRVELDQKRNWVDSMRATLSEDERLRAERFHFEKDRDHFITARGCLRDILGAYLGINPADVRFNYSEYGKPDLAEEINSRDLRFNISHSSGIALIAVTSKQDIGVDVEYMDRDLADENVARRFFSTSEVEILHSLPKDQRKEAFFNCWTRKEAYIKARGEGLSHPLDQFDVTLAPGEPAALLETRPDPDEADRWIIRELNPGIGYVGAVALRAHNLQLNCWQWSGRLA